MRKLWWLTLILVASLYTALPAWGFTGCPLAGGGEDDYRVSSGGWTEPYYVSYIRVEPAQTYIVFTNQRYIHGNLSSSTVLMSQAAMYANRPLRFKLSGGRIVAYQLE